MDYPLQSLVWRLTMFVSIFPILSWMAAAAPLPPEQSTALTFEHDVRPILKAYCFECHGESEKPEANLDLRLRRFAADGGRSGPGLVRVGRKTANC